MVTPKRKALIIGAPGSRDSQPLRGVQSDIRKTSKHLLSPQGGLWKSQEIRILYDPTFFELQRAYKRTTSDYTIIYFSGHGCQLSDGTRLLQLSDGSLFHDLSLLNDSPRQLILLDSCRNIIDPPIAGVPTLGDDTYGDPVEASLARKYYDHWINHCDSGKLILHSTKAGHYSYDLPGGGIFTNYFIDAAESVEWKGWQARLDALSVMALAKKELERWGEEQLPCVTYYEGNIRLPFALSPSKIYHFNKRTRRLKTNSEIRKFRELIGYMKEIDRGIKIAKTLFG